MNIVVASQFDVDSNEAPHAHLLRPHPLVRLRPHISTNLAASRPGHPEKILSNFDRHARGEIPDDLADPATGIDGR